jgi:hypothetical protein
MNTNIINLETYQTKGSRVFTGRDSGKAVREKSGIDLLAKQSDKISITIPSDIRSINPSFLEEFIKNIVTDLGETGFNDKIEFKISSDNYNKVRFEKDLTEAIERILREETALA